jgi:hypothetical protein
MLRAFGRGRVDRELCGRARIVGSAIVPNHYAVQLLEGIHPAVIARARTSRGSGAWMGATLATASVAMLLLEAWLLTLRVRTERLAAEVASLRREVEEGGGV